MLLTSGQISMTISSCVVFTFTSLLFLSGYVLQQQSVRSLQAAIRPPPAKPSITGNASPTAIAKTFGNPPGSEGHGLYEDYLAHKQPDGGWSRVAYVQLVREEVQVCDALILFGELHRQDSKARRLLIYPAIWDRRSTNRQTSDSSLEITMQLLRKAAEVFMVTLLPIQPILRAPKGAEDAAYPLAGLLSLTRYDRLIYLRSPGVILDAASLDQLFTKVMETSMLAVCGNSEEEVPTPPVLLLSPSMLAYQDSLSSIKVDTYTDDRYLQTIPLINQRTEAQFIAQISSFTSLASQIPQPDPSQRISYVYMNQMSEHGSTATSSVETSAIAKNIEAVPVDLPPDIRRGDAVDINVILEPLKKNEYEGTNANEQRNVR